MMAPTTERQRAEGVCATTPPKKKVVGWWEGYLDGAVHHVVGHYAGYGSPRPVRTGA